ncbi:MAG: GNAT family N-acetyltransferase [Acidobacteriota bacterium]
MSAATIRKAETETDIAAARKIFREYEAWLGLDLCFQGFEEELNNLPGKYSPPRGRLYLADAVGVVAGCIALRPLEPDVCEMKRLFVREEFRGMQLGKLLIEKLIEEAREIGYKAMRLDTFPPKMGKAVRLYESYGFREISAYYGNPNEGVLFMELTL